MEILKARDRGAVIAEERIRYSWSILPEMGAPHEKPRRSSVLWTKETTGYLAPEVEFSGRD